MEDAIQKMLYEMQLRGMSPGTQKNYGTAVRAFQNFHGKPARDLGEKEVREYLHYLREERKLSADTVNGYNSVLKFLYEKVFDKEWNTKNIPRLKHRRRLPAVLSKDEVQKIFNCTENLKHKCILMTVYGSGLRVSEVVRLKVRDIDSKNMQIFIHEGKGQKDRYTILSQVNLKILREYWKRYKPTDWLFQGHKKGTHISVRAIQKILEHAKDKAGIKKDISVHTLRHCFSTHLLEAGTNIYYVKELLGHTCIQTTCRYIHIMRMDMLNVQSPLDVDGGCSNG